MIALDRQVNGLYKVLDKIEGRINLLKNKIEALEDKTLDRKLTWKEQSMLISWQEAIDDLGNEYDEVQNAIDYLKDFCEEY